MLTSDKRSLSVLKLVLDGVWWLSIAAIALVGALLVLLAAHAIHSGAISVGSYLQLQPGTYQLTAHQLGGSSAEIRNVSAALAFPRPRAAFVLVGGAILAVAGAWLLTVLHQLRRLVGSAQKGQMFAPPNAGRIQRIGIAVIGFELVRSVAEWAGSMYLKGQRERPWSEPALALGVEHPGATRWPAAARPRGCVPLGNATANRPRPHHLVGPTGSSCP